MDIGALCLASFCDPVTFCVQRHEFPGKVLDRLCYPPDALAFSLGGSGGNVR